MYHAPRYDRALLLGEKRTEVLTLDEVRQYGRDSFGDPDYGLAGRGQLALLAAIAASRAAGTTPGGG